METYIALLRGINVGGHRKIKMADLRALLESLGFLEVRTYIQSGNVIFSTSENASESAQRISEGIKQSRGWEVPVLVIKPSEIKGILDYWPFPDKKKEDGYFSLLHQPPSEEIIAEANTSHYPGEKFVITPKCVYLSYSISAAKAKLNNNWFEKKLKVTATTRNFRTLKKLLDMVA